jgi:alpha-L-fucosidase
LTGPYPVPQWLREGKFGIYNLVDNLVDRVSKNGYLLLNVGPKPNGTIPDEAKRLLLGIRKWPKVNGEAIYGATPHIGRRTTIWISDAPRYIKRSRVKQSNRCLL